MAKVRRDRVDLHATEVEPLTSAKDRSRDLVNFSRRKHEDQMWWGLFKRLEQRIKRRRRQHVDFVDDVHLVPTRHRGVFGVIAKLSNIVNRIVRCSVDLDDVNAASLEHVCTRGTLVAWLVFDTVGAIQRTRQNPGAGSLANAPGSGEHIGMMNAPLTDRIFQRRRNMLLSDDIGKPEWTPFSGRDDVTLLF